MPDVLIAVTLFRAGDGAQLAGPAMVKTQPSHTIGRVAACVCRWAEVPAESCQLQYNGQPLAVATTVTEAGLVSSSAVNGVLAQGTTPGAAASAAAFAMLDVEDSELAHVAGSLGM